jgi:hypothetical protein
MNRPTTPLLHAPIGAWAVVMVPVEPALSAVH